ncbi:T9SS type A sorting domain-containing protein [Echinicola strongylocentroti]|uniref:T9SS type A sorting domain-containing protein n=1 Tax=Echinicola strongylocentroti TaxID=1795355 RepID=UPI0013A6AFEC|nr:T9SS type A sorting domain-containing protein [Echinicola strongylocentroti]
MFTKLRYALYVGCFLFSSSLSCLAQTQVTFDPTCQRYINDISTLDRSKYFTIHSSGNDPEHAALYEEYGVGQGRGFWAAFSAAKQQTGEVAAYPAPKSGEVSLLPVTRKIGTEHPYNVFVDGMDVEVAADWAVNYFTYWVDKEARPEFFEVMNEPFVHAKDFYEGGWDNAENIRIKKQMAALYGKVGERFDQSPALSNMKVIGYSSAWPSLELQDFGHWNENMKMFMDVAGEHMDAFATHLYDGVNVEGQDNKRSGSNAEAILDLIENYSYIKWNKVKPHAISEYGAIEKGYGENYSDLASIQTIRSINHILFGLLEREDLMEISIPFITGKAEWHINEANNYQPYQAVLWKPTNIGEPDPAGWEYTPRVNFYELWKNVKGQRVWIKSDNPDVQVQAFKDSNVLYLAFNNLDDLPQDVMLEGISLPEINQITAKSLKIYPDKAHEMLIEQWESLPQSLRLIAGETVVLEVDMNAAPEVANTMVSKKYYTENYLEAISANAPVIYSFDGVEKKADGYAVLRMSIGRKHDKSKQPTVKVNDKIVQVPDNWKGYDQANRDDFFGMIEIPVPYAFIKDQNQVEVTFPDSQGHISSLILQVHSFEHPRENVIVGMENKTKFNSEGFRFYPNPVGKTLSISWEGEFVDASPMVDIYSQEGTEVQISEPTILSRKVLVDMGTLSPGLYTAYIQIGDVAGYGKIIKR